MIYQITDYKIVDEESSGLAVISVQDLISRGYQPKGKLIVTMNRYNNLRFIQKMVKYAQ